MKDTLENIAAYLRAPLAPEHRFASGLLALVALRLLMGILLVLDLPPLEGHVPPWYFHTGGDQHTYYRMASELLEGRISDDIVSLGQGLTDVADICGDLIDILLDVGQVCACLLKILLQLGEFIR